MLAAGVLHLHCASYCAVWTLPGSEVWFQGIDSQTLYMLTAEVPLSWVSTDGTESIHTHVHDKRFSNQQVTLEYNHSWEGTNHSVTHNILWLLWIPKVHYCDHNSPPVDLMSIHCRGNINFYTFYIPSITALNYCTNTKILNLEGTQKLDAV